ncbi:MAG: hypothetical protein WBA25_02690 [Jannaschia sp.]
MIRDDDGMRWAQPSSCCRTEALAAAIEGGGRREETALEAVLDRLDRDREERHVEVTR